jgi:hypothetical protein
MKEEDEIDETVGASDNEVEAANTIGERGDKIDASATPMEATREEPPKRWTPPTQTQRSIA